VGYDQRARLDPRQRPYSVERLNDAAAGMGIGRKAIDRDQICVEACVELDQG